MKTTFKSNAARLAVLAALVWAGACNDSNGAAGGDTHWLGACERDSQCQSGACWCGACTRPCSGDGACKEEKTACFETESPVLVEHCAGRSLPTAKGICLGLCSSDDECLAGSECLLGACVPEPRGTDDAGARPGEGEPGAHPRPELDGSTPQASAFADVNIPADFTDPVMVPPPDDTITGNASAFLGTWIANPAQACGIIPCTHLEFKAGSNGSITGTLYVQPTDRPTDAHGPYPPATDPDVGYPVGLTPSDYRSLRVNNTAGVTYTVFDGQAHNNQVDFWTSRAELWTDWCKLQTPYTWDLNGTVRYRCVPQSATEADTDRGKLSLCATPWDGKICTLTGNPYPCSCLDGEGMPTGNPDCTLFASVCECTKSECHAAVRVSEVWSRLDAAGDTLVGQLSADPETTTRDTTFTRETP